MQERKQYHSNISYIYKQTKKAFDLRQNSVKFWFSGILSAAEQCSIVELNDDVERWEREELVSMLNSAFVDVIGFMSSQPFDSVYKLLGLMKVLLKIDEGSPNPTSTLKNPPYRLIMHQLHFLNTLGLFALRSRQYTYALKCYDLIFQIYDADSIDTSTEIMLAATSNYLLCLKHHQQVKLSQHITQLSQKLSYIYRALLQKYLKNGCNEQSLLLLLTVYRQQESTLKAEFKEENIQLIKKYSNIKDDVKESISLDMMLLRQVYLRNRENRFTQLNIKRSEYDFFATLQPARNIKSRSSVLRKTKQRYTSRLQAPEDRLENIEKLLSESIQKTQTQSKLFSQENNQKTLQNKETIETVQKTNTIRQAEPITFRHNHIYLEMSGEGIIICNFLKENKNYLTWNTCATIMKKLRYTVIFQHLLPIQNYYDVSIVLALYLKQTLSPEHRKVIALTDRPSELINLNMHIKIYHHEGNLFKVCVMNHYNPSILEYVMNLYIEQLSIYFKQSSSNEYIQHLNHQLQNHPEEEGNKIYGLGGLKKLKESSWAELQHHLKLQDILSSLSMDTKKKKTNYLILLKKGCRKICFSFDSFSQDYIQYRILDMTTPEVKERTLKIPIYKLEYYFPIGKSVETWMEHYSKILIEGYIHCLSDIPYTFVNQNYFQSHVYGKVIQIGMYGKYKTPYIAMMVGSKHRIWGMCIKVYEVTSASEHRVFIVNPYYELFNYLLTQNEKQRRETLLSQLSEGSVEKTYNLLKKRGWQNKTLLFTEYWSIL